MGRPDAEKWPARRYLLNDRAGQPTGGSVARENPLFTWGTTVRPVTGWRWESVDTVWPAFVIDERVARLGFEGDTGI